MAGQRKRLSDILHNNQQERLEKVWSVTTAADDLKPIPSGDYRCRVLSGELCQSKRGTPGYKVTFEVLEGEHAGRRVWHDIWLTEAALAMAKRVLAKLGITHPSQLEQSLPKGMIVAARVSLLQDDNGSEHNRVMRFALIKIDPPEADPFAPDGADAGNESRTPRTPEKEALDETADMLDGDGFDWSNGAQRNGVPTS